MPTITAWYGGTELPQPQDNYKDINFIFKGETKVRRGFVFEQKIMYDKVFHSFDEVEHWRFIHNKIED